MMLLCDYDRILRVAKFCGKIIIFCTENPYSKLFLGRTFLIFKISAPHFKTNYVFSMEIFCLQLNYKENISEIPLSETRNHTLIHVELYLFLYPIFQASDIKVQHKK